MSATMTLTTASSRMNQQQHQKYPQHVYPKERSPQSPYSPASLSSPATSISSSSTNSSCPRCGFSSPSSSAATSPLYSGSGASEADSVLALAAARRQIDDLQNQVRILNEKAMAAVGKWADYEDELSRLRMRVNRSSRGGGGDSVASSTTGSPLQQQTQTMGSLLPAGTTGRISALWAAKSTPNLKDPVPPARAQTLGAAVTATNPQTPGFNPHQHRRSRSGDVDQTTDDLLVALTREQHLRVAAEARVHETSREVEELSATLFEQANEMVADERRARARLEERVEVLERRDAEKRRRLERLEGAVGRIEHVKKLLSESA